MNKSKILVTLLAVLLISSIGANVYFTSFLTAPNNGDTLKLGMFSTLWLWKSI